MNTEISYTGITKRMFAIAIDYILHQFPLYKKRIDNNGKKPY